MKKELLFSLSKDKGDFIVQTCRCGGHGGQNVNKLETAVKIIHPASGAVGESREERTQGRNKKIAFKRLVESEKFKNWHRLKSAYALKGIQDFKKEVERKVSEQMKPENLTIEYFEVK